ncbi:hypothetical protein Mgra_00007516 [Meloidogyne graminicola]|uniref:NADH dehydrogenase [ubiquinone] 1 alpha subcomplex subunit 5 n=1 Tax=Meloidogyne graminicola TaxID=189291 RepID=A0A8S9ZII6_9BILA|nr:hypothetical protein Mgra_00007516 [Meloidogyne graminicola]
MNIQGLIPVNIIKMSRMVSPIFGNLSRLHNLLSSRIVSIRTIIHTDEPFPTEMFENPFVREHQRKRDEVPKDFHKQGTGLCGLYVNTHPHKDLSELYIRILRVLELMPIDYVYRQTTEQIVKERFAHVNTESDIQLLEEKIGMGQIEEVIEQARNELETARTLVYFKAWEPLVEAPDEYQWRWPIAPGP